MKNKNLLLVGSLVTLSVITVAVINPVAVTEKSVYQPRSSETDFDAKTGGDAAIEYYRSKRVNPATGLYDEAYLREVRENMIAYNLENQTRATALNWMEEGPDNVGGRTRAICIDRNDANHVFAGSVSGGLFVSNNAANNWVIVPGFSEYLRISSMCQTLDGTYYVGTGSSFDNWGGDGIWSSTDNGVTWTLVTGSTAFSNVDELQADPNVADKIWIVGDNSSGGAKTYTPGGGFVAAGNLTGADYIDIKLSPDGTIVVAGRGAAGSVTTFVSTDSGNNFSSVSGATGGLLPSSGRSRMEYAVSFDKNSNNNYTIYASASQGCLESVHISEDNGVTWYEIAPAGGSNFDPFSNPGLGCQGSYDHMLGAVPGNPNNVLIGGTQAIYKWVKSTTANPVFGQWYQKTFAYASEFSPIYVHADQHEIKWDQNDILYIGSDGGVSKSFDKGENIWVSHNRGYNVTQFYSVAFNKFGHTMGGAQDNGTQYKNFTGVTSLEYSEVMGGDGFDCDISHINPDVMFATIYNGDFNRSDDEGNSFEFFAPLTSGSVFHTVGRLYENPNDTDSQDSVLFIADTIYNIGDVINYVSRTNQMPLTHTLTVALAEDDTITLQDPVQSIYAAGYSGSSGVYITRHALRFNVTPEWEKVIPTVGSASVTAIEFAANGEVMYVGTSNGSLYVVENLNTFYSPANDISGVTVTTIAGFGGINGIGVDPQDEDHIVIAHGNSLHETSSATTATGFGSFSEITASLPSVGTYDAIIDYQDPNTIVIGTETGVYVTDNGGSTWVYQSQMGLVPVEAVRQQWRTSDCWNSGVVYIGTFGRGIWSTNSLVGINDPDATAVAHVEVTEINTYPNPMNNNGTISFKLKERNNVDIYVMDLAGKIVLTKNLGEMNAGEVNAEINVSELASGSYVVMIKAGDETGTDKLVVTH